MTELTYTCPNCDTHYVVWDESMPPISMERHNDLSEYIRKQYDEVGTCKFCVRKNPYIPTTAEVDGLLTSKDMKDRFYIMKPCLKNGHYNKQDTRQPDTPCIECGSEMGQLSTYWSSLRTFRPGRKLTNADMKKMGA